MKSLYKRFIRMPFLRRYKNTWYRQLGVQMMDKSAFIGTNVTLVGKYSNIVMHPNSQIETGCLIVAKDRVEIGENSCLAYGAVVMTSANPNGPKNKLAALYPSIHAPVIIKDNVWVGAHATILPGVTIGEMSVVAAGAVVTKDVPPGVLVAGVPAIIKKKLI